MSIRQKLRTIARPGRICKRQLHLWMSERLRERNRVSLVCFNDLEVHACRIVVDQVPAIRRYSPVRDPVFVRIRCELLQLQFMERRGWLLLAFGKPQTSNNKEQHAYSGADPPSAEAARFHLSLQFPQFRHQFQSVLKASLAVLLDSLIDNGIDLGRDLRIQIPDRTRNLVEDRVMKHWSAVPGESTLPGCHFIKNQAKRKKICPRV